MKTSEGRQSERGESWSTIRPSKTFCFMCSLVFCSLLAVILLLVQYSRGGLPLSVDNQDHISTVSNTSLLPDPYRELFLSENLQD